MFITKLPILASGLVLALICETTVAQASFYLHGSLGYSDTDISLGGLNHVADDQSSYALGAGYAFTANIALEIAYRDFGSHDGETECPPGYACLVIPVLTTADVTGISLSLIGSIPLAERLNLFGKIGLTSWNVDFAGISAAFDDSGQDLLYGGGLRWSINDRWKIFAEYERHDFESDTAAIGVNLYF